MAWFGLAKIALQAGSKIYANRQKTKMAMSDAQLMHAERMAEGKESYQGKLLEARQNDYKDEIVLAILTAHNCARLVGVDRGSGGYAEDRDLF
jgi:hypothetical protein